MLMRTLLLLSVVTFHYEAICQSARFIPDSSILFQVSKGKELLKDCSGSEYQQVVDSFWIPSQSQYLELQGSFSKLANQSIIVDNYIIQFLGIVLNGKQYIYINGFPKSELDVFKRANQDLATSAVIVCGGGRGFWRTLFDVDLKEFIGMRINAPK